MSAIPEIVPPLPRPRTHWQRLPISAPFRWLYAGSRDLMVVPGPSLLYGLFVFVVSAAIVAGIFWAGIDYILLPALSAFIIAGPVLALGLYQKSRLLSKGHRARLRDMLFVEARSTGQILFIGALLALLAMAWIRASVIVYALFFGLRPFPGMEQIVPVLVLTPTGWAMLTVGTLIGGLFAALSFSISFLSVPMLLDQRIDAFTAMGNSMVMAWNNRSVTICWGAIVVALMLFAIVTGLLGLIVVFPLLGHATWHAYLDFKASRSDRVA